MWISVVFSTQFKKGILFEKGCELVAVLELYGSQDHKLIIFMNLTGSVLLIASCNRNLYFLVH